MKEIIVRRVGAKVEFGAGATCAFGQLLKNPDLLKCIIAVTSSVVLVTLVLHMSRSEIYCE